jgi:hypothetical protein
MTSANSFLFAHGIHAKHFLQLLALRMELQELRSLARLPTSNVKLLELHIIFSGHM